MDHLVLEIFDLATAENPKPTGSKNAVLPDDTTITITDTSEIFASGDVWSHSFQLNVQANVHIFGSSGDLHGSRLHDQIDKRKARLWVEGLPLYLGYLRLDDEAEVDADGNVDISFESGQKTFEDLIDGAKANQVPLMGDVPIGVALWRKREVEYGLEVTASAVFADEGKTISPPAVIWHDKQSESDDPNVTTFYANGENDNTPVQEYPRMVFPKGDFRNMDTWQIEHIDCLNVDNPYAENADGTPTHPYCNVALCYQKYGYKKKDDQGNEVMDYSSEPEAQRGYEYMPANRVNSAPNFYVIYWIRALMKHLGIYIEENQMLEVEDLRRLFFVNTKCAYRLPKHVRDGIDDNSMARYRFVNHRLVAESVAPQVLMKTEECNLIATSFDVSKPAGWPDIERININVTKVIRMTDHEKNMYEASNNYLHDAYATSGCFPDVDISEVISAIENGFGIRFLFSDNYQRVRIVLLRNIFRSKDVQHIQCEMVGEDVKVENSIRGFRMTYGKGKEDTHFYYKGFADKLPHKKELWIDDSDKHDYSQWDLNAVYGDIINKVTAFNKTCYVTPETGNAQIIKVDKDAKRYEDLHQSLFETAGFMDAEDGDCTGEDETIHEINVGFTPAIMNDLNMGAERSGSQEQRFALFVDEKMRPRRHDLNDGQDYNNPDAFYDVNGKLYAITRYGPGGVAFYYNYESMMVDGVVKPGEFAITSDMPASVKNLKVNIDYLPRITYNVTNLNIEGSINEGYRLYLQDNYEPNDDGVSPIETHDWGLTLGIMRGSGSDAHVAYDADPDDGEGNDTWDIVPGSSATAHPDTCDSYGHQWGYATNNGSATDGRISLKLRAEKPNPYYVPGSQDEDKKKQYLEISNASLQRRGLSDQFYSEFSLWIRNARIARRPVKMEMAQLLAIDKTKRATVGDIFGFIRKMQFQVSKKTGLGLVTMEMLYI